MFTVLSSSVVALDMRGYCESEVPKGAQNYEVKKLVGKYRDKIGSWFRAFNKSKFVQHDTLSKLYKSNGFTDTECILRDLSQFHQNFKPNNLHQMHQCSPVGEKELKGALGKYNIIANLFFFFFSKMGNEFMLSFVL